MESAGSRRQSPGPRSTKYTFGDFLRTIGIKFVVLRGPLDTTRSDLGEWVSVGIYGMIGTPIKGFEHEAIGLEINNI